MEAPKAGPTGFRSLIRDRFRSHRPSSWRRNHPVDFDDDDNIPIPLPRFRPRALSNERAFDQSLDESTHYLVSRFPYTLQQTQSSLFARLPYHLRLRIFSFAIGSSTFHLRTQPAAHGPKLVMLDCVFPENEGSFNLSLLHPCWRYSSRFAGQCAGSYSKLADFPDPKPVALLGLLRCCRRAYTEAVDVLYAQSAFTFDRLQPLIDLSNTILPTRLGKIRRVSLAWSFGSLPALIKGTQTPDFTRWQTVCHILAAMPEIRELVILMKGDTGTHKGNLAWLEPISQIVPRYTKPQLVLSFLPSMEFDVSGKSWDWHYRTFGRLVTNEDSTPCGRALSEAEREQVWTQIEGFGRSVQS